MATLIVGVSTGLYRRTRERLETKNRALQEAVEQEAPHRDWQEKKLRQTHEIQQSLLPKSTPQIDGFEIDGAWEPAREVGGDYFDVIQLKSHQAWYLYRRCGRKGCFRGAPDGERAGKLCGHLRRNQLLLLIRAHE